MTVGWGKLPCHACLSEVDVRGGETPWCCIRSGPRPTGNGPPGLPGLCGPPVNRNRGGDARQSEPRDTILPGVPQAEAGHPACPCLCLGRRRARKGQTENTPPPSSGLRSLWGPRESLPGMGRRVEGGRGEPIQTLRGPASRHRGPRSPNAGKPRTGRRP